MSSTKDFDPAMALAERSRQRGDVVFIQLDGRGRAYPECGRPIWMENTVIGQCDAVAPWSVLLPAGNRLYCTAHAHTTLSYLDAFAESQRAEAARLTVAEAVLAAEAAARLEETFPESIHPTVPPADFSAN